MTKRPPAVTLCSLLCAPGNANRLTDEWFRLGSDSLSNRKQQLSFLEAVCTRAKTRCVFLAVVAPRLINAIVRRVSLIRLMRAITNDNQWIAGTGECKIFFFVSPSGTIAERQFPVPSTVSSMWFQLVINFSSFFSSRVPPDYTVTGTMWSPTHVQVTGKSWPRANDGTDCRVVLVFNRFHLWFAVQRTRNLVVKNKNGKCSFVSMSATR